MLALLDPPYLVAGLVDEPAHLATAALLLAALPVRLPPPVVAAALAASVLIDVDHLPGVLGTDAVTEGVPRPYTHSLLTPALLAGAGLLARGRARLLLLGAALGIVLHLVRDLAGDPGVALGWPVTWEDVSYPLALYLAAMLLAAGRAWAVR